MKTIVSTVKPEIGFHIEVLNMETGKTTVSSNRISTVLEGSYINSYVCQFDGSDDYIRVIYIESK